MEEYDDLDDLPARPRQVIPAADRELLELAGRALGAARVEDVEGENWVNLHFDNSPNMHGWNPLLHADDALILAVRLELDIMHRVVGGHRVEILPPGGPLTVEPVGANPLEAACRAITRTAAQIGKQRS